MSERRRRGPPPGGERPGGRRPDEAIEQTDNLTPFERALAGIDSTDLQGSPCLVVIDGMRRLVAEVNHAPVVQSRLREFFYDGGPIGRRHDRRARRRSPAEPSGDSRGRFVDITPPEFLGTDWPSEPAHRPVVAPAGERGPPVEPRPTPWSAPAAGLGPTADAAAHLLGSDETMLYHPDPGHDEIVDDGVVRPLRPRRRWLSASVVSAAAVAAVVGGAVMTGQVDRSAETTTRNTQLVGPADAGDAVGQPAAATGEGERAPASLEPDDDGAAPLEEPDDHQSDVARSGVETDGAGNSTTAAEDEDVTTTSVQAPSTEQTEGDSSVEEAGSPTTSTEAASATTASVPATTASAERSRRITGRVFQGASDGPAAVGTVVEIYDDRDGNGRPGTRVDTAVIASSGRYSFDVPSGCYVIRFGPVDGFRVQAGPERPLCVGGGRDEGEDARNVDGPDAVVLGDGEVAPPSRCVVELGLRSGSGVEIHEDEVDWADSYRLYGSSDDVIAETADLGPADDVDSPSDHEWHGIEHGFDHRLVERVSAVRGGVESALIRCDRES